MLFIILFAIFGVARADYEGTCGANLTWVLNTTTNTLTINGTGAMTNFDSGAPWYPYKDLIVKVIINTGATTIGKSAFEFCENLTSGSLCNTISNIGENSFYNCNKLATVNIPNSVNTIGSWAFTNCYSLTQVTIGENVSQIGVGVFWDCTALQTINWNAIDCDYNNSQYHSFSSCTNLKTVVFGNKVKTIPDGVFYACNNLQNVTLGSSILSIGNSSFEKCSKLASITLPNSLISIGSRAFEQCSNLKQISFGNSLTTIEDYAFSKCVKLATVSLPNSIRAIGFRAFEECYQLTSLSLGNGLLTINDAAFCDCINLHSFIMPSSLKRIGIDAFENCSEITEVNFPINLDSIRQMCFANCSKLETIYWDVQDLKYNQSNLFPNCNKLKNVIIGDNVTAIPNTGFIFENWTEDNVIVSNNSIYSFVADKNKTIIAHFKQNIDVDENYKPSFIIYPNPTNAYVEIVSDLNCYIYITDIMGRVLSSQTTSTETTQVDLCDLPSGIYFVSLIHDNKKTTQKIIKL